MPSILLSGFMFPYEAMPIGAQWVAEALPATHFIRMVRGIVLREAEVMSLGQDALWLLGFTCIGVLLKEAVSGETTRECLSLGLTCC
jgi:ABC-2 type transport system permease protein